MTNTIQQLKEEIMDGLAKDYGYLPAFYMISVDVSTSIDKVIKATAYAMVGEEDIELGTAEKQWCHVGKGYLVCYCGKCKGDYYSIPEEKALRDEITQ